VRIFPGRHQFKFGNDFLEPGQGRGLVLLPCESPSGGGGFQSDTHLDYLIQASTCDRGQPYPLIGRAAHEPLALEEAKGLSYRDAAHAERACKIRFDDPIARENDASGGSRDNRLHSLVNQSPRPDRLPCRRCSEVLVRNFQ
jgi:hypothetical protein